MIWLVLTAFWEPGAVSVSDLVDKTGVDTLTAGRLRAAGSMSGIVDRGERDGELSRAAVERRATRGQDHGVTGEIRDTMRSRKCGYLDGKCMVRRFADGERCVVWLAGGCEGVELVGVKSEFLAAGVTDSEACTLQRNCGG